MLSNYIRNMIGIGKKHRRIAGPLATMRMDNIGLAILPDISRKHRLHTSYPTPDVWSDDLGKPMHEMLIDGNAVCLVPIRTERIAEITPATNAERQLHIADDAHFMPQRLQSLCLFQTKLSTVGREERG